ncbi:MAG: acetyl-CoA carboxylase alpha subunit [Ulvibacter sp.]|mgnify:CR=1 FL=1
MLDAFTVNCHGEQTPVADSATAGGRAKINRENIAIVPNDKMKDDAKKELGENGIVYPNH